MSDIANSRKLQQEINNRLYRLEKKVAKDKQSKGAYFELQDLKEWVIENQQANEKPTSDKASINYKPLLSVVTDKEIEDHIWEEISIPLNQTDIDDQTDGYISYLNGVHWAKWMRNKLSNNSV